MQDLKIKRYDSFNELAQATGIPCGYYSYAVANQTKEASSITIGELSFIINHATNNFEINTHCGDYYQFLELNKDQALWLIEKLRDFIDLGLQDDKT